MYIYVRQKFIYTSKNNLRTWWNFTSHHILMETDLSQFHAATTACTETADQDSHKHLQGEGWAQEFRKYGYLEPWNSLCSTFTYGLHMKIGLKCENLSVWSEESETLAPYALTPVWQEYWPDMYRVTAFITQNCSYNSKYFEVSLSFCASFMNTVLLPKSN
jgi:hypothetical protein